MKVIIEPDRAAVNEIQKQLEEMGKGKSVNRALQKAINEVAAAGKNMLFNTTRSTYTIKPSEFKKNDIARKSATLRHLVAVVSVRGSTPGIRKGYKTKKNSKKVGAKAQILRSGNMKELVREQDGKSYKAFLATMKSGHEGIFQRVPGKPTKEYLKSGGKSKRKFKKPHENKTREAIKEIMAMSKAKAAEMVYLKENMYDQLQDEINSRMMKHMEAVIGGLK